MTPATLKLFTIPAMSKKAKTRKVWVMVLTGNKCPHCGDKCMLRSDGEKESEVCRSGHLVTENYKCPESLEPWAKILRSNAFVT